MNGRAVSCGDDADAISKLTMPKDVLPNDLSSDFQVADLLYTTRVKTAPHTEDQYQESGSHTPCLQRTTSKPSRTRMAISEDSHPSFVIRSLENLVPSFHPRKIVMYVSIGKLEFKEEDRLWTCHEYIGVNQ